MSIDCERVEGDRLEVGLLDHDELALGELPALDELVGLDVALVEGAPALLLDRRAALAVQRPEGHVLALLRDGEPDRDVDQAEVDGAVPDRAHESQKSLAGPGTFSPQRRIPSTGPRGGRRPSGEWYQPSRMLEIFTTSPEFGEWTNRPPPM